MRPSECVQELKALLQLSYDFAERIVALKREFPSDTLTQVYTEVESLSVLLDRALRESINGSN